MGLQHTKSPFSPDSGEKVAGRPDEGALKHGSMQKLPQYPQVVCGSIVFPTHNKALKRLGGHWGEMALSK